MPPAQAKVNMAGLGLVDLIHAPPPLYSRKILLIHFTSRAKRVELQCRSLLPGSPLGLALLLGAVMRRLLTSSFLCFPRLCDLESLLLLLSSLTMFLSSFCLLHPNATRYHTTRPYTTCFASRSAIPYFRAYALYPIFAAAPFSP